MKSQVQRQWPLFSVYALFALGLLALNWVNFRIGAALLSLTILYAAVLRWRLTDSAAGWLRVRRRRIDLVVLATLGFALLTLALALPAHQL
ncbi:MAG: DUF3017 domain-containing protein [Actinobacteria bacterium]|nr:DUF3017 domain-containing protein [Actinomycetota bacterium]NBY15324.1 DUF3017 domain-containing protein [Actinomycetota bacterium]